MGQAMGIAFFDLDETVIDFNSGGAWLRAELLNGNISIRQFLRGGFGLLRYRLGAADIEPLLYDGVASQAGLPEAEMEARCRQFYHNRVRGKWRAGALRALDEARQRQQPRVLLTTASVYLAREVADELDLEGALATRLEVDADGLFTGKVDGPLSFGQGKVKLASNYASRHGVSLDACCFFSDSFSDRPMFEAVGHPVVVHPDRRLRRLAKHKGWPIEMW